MVGGADKILKFIPEEGCSIDYLSHYLHRNSQKTRALIIGLLSVNLISVEKNRLFSVLPRKSRKLIEKTEKEYA